MKRLILPLVVIACLYGCIRDEFVLNENIQIDNLDPSFALPLGSANINLGKAEEAFDSDDFVYNEGDQTFAIIYREELFNITASEMISTVPAEFQASHALSASESTTANLTPAGSTYSYGSSESISFPTTQGEELDSITFNAGTIDIDFSSEVPASQTITFTIPGLTLNGNVFEESVILIYSGSLPMTETASFDLTGYSLDLTDGGTTTNTIEMDIEVEATSSGETTSEGMLTNLNVTLNLEEFGSIWGYFGQVELAALENVQQVDVYGDLTEGVLHFEEPSIHFTVTNSSGVPVDIMFSSVYAPANSAAQTITGADLSNVPIIAAADLPGETAITEHAVTNDGTSPTISTMLDEGPFELIYNSTSTINPEGPQQNFVLDSSKVTCSAELMLPFFGYADDFSFQDTTDLDLEESLGFGPDDVLTEDDIEQVTIRMIADNGLPIQIGLQAYFTDTMFNVLDSLFIPGTQNIFEPGFIDFGLDENHPDFGKVTQPTRQIVDFTITGKQVSDLMDQNSKKLIFRAVGITSNAPDEVVKFFPEYNMAIKLSAKVDTNIDLTE